MFTFAVPCFHGIHFVELANPDSTSIEIISSTIRIDVTLVLVYVKYKLSVRPPTKH